MVLFDPAEIVYLKEMDLGRIATADSNGQPHVTPVTFQFEPASNTLIIPGFEPASRKGRDLRANRKVGFVVDDVVSLEPFQARRVVIHGKAEVYDDGGEWHPEGVGGAWLRILPGRVVSWGLNEDVDVLEGGILGTA
jgi:pyridoxamine 5'-phosphate oxidase family protein